MAVLVTGGMGAIGSFVTRRLVEIGVEPVVYARHKDTTILSDIEKKLIFVEGDILDLDKLVQTMKTYAIDRVIHASAIVPGGFTPPTASPAPMPKRPCARSPRSIPCRKASPLNRGLG